MRKFIIIHQVIIKTVYKFPPPHSWEIQWDPHMATAWLPVSPNFPFKNHCRWIISSPPVSSPIIWGYVKWQTQGTFHNEEKEKLTALHPNESETINEHLNTTRWKFIQQWSCEMSAETTQLKDYNDLDTISTHDSVKITIGTQEKWAYTMGRHTTWWEVSYHKITNTICIVKVKSTFIELNIVEYMRNLCGENYHVPCM